MPYFGALPTTMPARPCMSCGEDFHPPQDQDQCRMCWPCFQRDLPRMRDAVRDATRRDRGKPDTMPAGLRLAL